MSTSLMFLYNPNDEGEWPIFDPDDKCEECGLTYAHYMVAGYPRGATVKSSAGHFCSHCNETVPVELVFNLDGWRGHYLTADYINMAVELIEASEHKLTYKQFKALIECEKDALTYKEHGGQCPPETITSDDVGMCDSCLYIFDSYETVEDIMTDLGYITLSNDGVYVYQRVEVEVEVDQ